MYVSLNTPGVNEVSGRVILFTPSRSLWTRYDHHPFINTLFKLLPSSRNHTLHRKSQYNMMSENNCNCLFSNLASLLRDRPQDTGAKIFCSFSFLFKLLPYGSDKFFYLPLLSLLPSFLLEAKR